MKKFGFTVSEVLITLGILGVIAAFTIPMLVNTIPDKDEENHKKASYQIEQIISQMYSDESMYPQSTEFDKQGFKNTDTVIINGKTYSGNTKFCELFAAQFEKQSDVKCGDLDDAGSKSFTSSDGMNWYLPKTTFSKGWTEIMVDINGNQIRKGNTANGCFKNGQTCKKPDLYKYYVRANGTVVASTDDTDPEEPTDDSSKPYSIDVEIKCNDESASCGTVTLKTLKEGTEDEYDVIGTKTGNGGVFSKLSKGTYYLTSTPATDYYSNVFGNTKTIKITGSVLNTKTKVIFTKKDKHCIFVNVNDCDKTALTDCGSFTVQKYKFAIPEGETSISKQLTGSSMNLTQKDDDSTNFHTMQLCDLPIGDYKLTVTPKENYYILPTPYNDAGEIISSYYQDVRLGTQDVTFTVTFTDVAPSASAYGSDDEGTSLQHKSLASYSYLSCNGYSNTDYCGSMPSLNSYDYWAYANYTCKSQGEGWRLPTYGELYSMFSDRSTYGLSNNTYYWTSDEVSKDFVNALKYNTSNNTIEGITQTKSYTYLSPVMCVK